MVKKTIAITICLMMIMTFFPVGVMAEDVQQSLPIYDEMESASIELEPGSGSVSLTQDRMVGDYAVKVDAGDVPSQDFVHYTLAESAEFDISSYSKIKLWVKPGAGAQWIKFLTGNNVLIKNDKNGDGIFRIGEDLISGQWNEITLDLTKTSNPLLTEAIDLAVHTNEYSTWTYDGITSVYSPAFVISPSQLLTGQTEIVNGDLRFKSNGTTSYGTLSTVLIPSNMLPAVFSRNSTAYDEEGIVYPSGQPRFKTGQFGDGLMIEEGTTNLVSGANAEVGSFSWLVKDVVHPVTGKTVKSIVLPHYGSTPLSGILLNLLEDTDYTVSYEAWHDGTGPDIVLRNDLFPDSLPQFDQLVTSTPKRYAKTIQSSNVDINNCQLRFFHYNQGRTIYITNIQLEQKSFDTSFHPSIRANEAITLPATEILNNESFTLELTWIPNHDSNATNSSVIFQAGKSGDEYQLRYYQPDSTIYWAKYQNNIRVGFSSIPITFSKGDQIQIKVTHDMAGNVDKLYVKKNDENISNSATNGQSVELNYDRLHIGCWLDRLETYFNYFANGIIDDLRISSITRTDQEIADSYNSGQPLPIDQYTACKLDFDNTSSYNLPNGEISKIYIDSSYFDIQQNAALSSLPIQRTYSSIQPTKITISGDGKRVFYGTLNGKVYMLDLTTGENKEICAYPLKSEIKVNYDGTKAAFIAYYNSYDRLYSYNALTNSLTDVNYSGVIKFDMQKDGSICYYDHNDDKIYLYNGSTSETVLSYIPTIEYLDISDIGADIFYSLTWYDNDRYLYKVTKTPVGWKSEATITSKTLDFDGIWSNTDGSMVFYKTGTSIYSYNILTKASKKLDLAGTIVKVTEDNKLAYQDTYSRYKLYDPDTDTSIDIRPSDAKNPTVPDIYFDIDSAGKKMAYVATGGVSTYYFNGVERPERYLFSFDGKNSWHTYKDGVWSVVKTGAVPAEENFAQYGMTIDEVNAMNEGDFAPLYADGRQVLHFDTAIYFASIDPYVTPSLKSITVTLNGGDSYLGDMPLEKALYTTKSQSFDASNWRKIRRIYPVEIQPKAAEMYYFMVKDGVTPLYYSYKDNQWSPVDSTLLSDVENNWIAITQQGMTAEELRAIPELDLTSQLAGASFSVVNAMKVDDLSTEGYNSLITVDYVEDLFVSANLVLKITLTDGTIKQYSGLTDIQVEDFMQWLNERQYNRGPNFYTIKTTGTDPGVVQVNGFVNYYTIQYVDVEEME